MKTSPNSPRTDDTGNRGMDAALALAVLAGVGLALDRWLGTTPWLTIAFTLLAAAGVFGALKYRYVATMTRLEGERLPGSRSSSTASEET